MAKAWIILAVSIFSHWQAAAETYDIFEENGMVGLKDGQGNVLIPASYEALGWSEGPFSVISRVTGYKTNGLWGIIGLDNKPVTKPEFITLAPAGADLLVAYKKPASISHVLAGCLDTAGREVIPFQYEGIKVNALRAIVFASIDGKYKYGVVDMDNKPVIPLQYQHISQVGSLRYAAEDFQGRKALYADSGKQLTAFLFDDIQSFKKDHAIIWQGGRCGVIGREGALKVQPVYSDIVMAEDGSAKGQKDNEWVVLDGQNKIFEKVTADTLVPLKNNLFGLKKESTFRLVNAQFAEVTAGRFDAIGPFASNQAIIAQNGKYGLIASNGTVVIDCKYAAVKPEKNYVLACVQPGQWVLLDSMGTQKSRKAYERIERFNGIYFAVKHRNHYGAINADGKEIISCVYDSIVQYNEGKLVVKFHGSYGIIDLQEEWIVSPQAFPQRLISSDRYLLQKGSTTFLKSFDGTVIYFTENKVIVKDDHLVEPVSNGGTWKVDFDGRIVSRQLPPVDPYELIYEESEGLRGIKKDGRFGFVDDQGRLRIANRYEDIMPFRERMAAVKILGKWGFVDHDEKLVIQPVYESTSFFKNGIAVVMQKDLYGLIDTKGTVVLPLRYRAITQLPSKRFLLGHDGQKGLADTDGRLIVAPKYDHIEDLNNGYIIVARNGKYGLITTQGLSTVPMMYDSIVYDAYNARYFALKKAAWEKVL